MRRMLLPSAIALTMLLGMPAAAEDTRLCKQGEEAFGHGNHKLAVNLLTLCINNGKLGTEALARASLYRGNALLSLDKFNGALNDLNRTISMRKNLAPAYASRALIFARTKKHGLAVVDYDRAIRFNPENARLYYNRALSHMGARDYQRALKDLDKSEQLDRNFAGAINYNRGVVFAKLKLYDKAVSSFDHAIHLRWQMAVNYLNRGVMFLRAKKFDAAVTSLNYSISLKPNYGDAFTYRGLAREGQNDRQMAITDYETAVGYGTTVNWTQKRISQLRAAK